MLNRTILSARDIKQSLKSVHRSFELAANERKRFTTIKRQGITHVPVGSIAMVKRQQY
jgi:hypothetical protein